MNQTLKLAIALAALVGSSAYAETPSKEAKSATHQELNVAPLGKSNADLSTAATNQQKPAVSHSKHGAKSSVMSKKEKSKPHG